MNELVQQLAEHSGFYYTDKTGFITPTGCDLEKFAELLVKECAAEAHRRVCTEGNDNMIYANLLAHFGVEE